MRDTDLSLSRLLERREWLMYPGERAALEGLLAALKPRLAVEIGTDRGGSLERISTHSTAVHAFDLLSHPELRPDRFSNVTFHIGDSHQLLAPFLTELAREGTNVDFALVDGDHTAEGARRDLEDLLSSPAVGQTVIVLHDTLNERVRAGFEGVDYAGHEKVRFVDLDFVPGRVFREGPLENDLWCGLGVVVTGHAVGGDLWPETYPATDVYGAFGAALATGSDGSERLRFTTVLELEKEIWSERIRAESMERSLSWRVTRPLRSARGLLRGRSRP